MDMDLDLDLSELDVPATLPERAVDPVRFNEALVENYQRMVRSGQLDVRALQDSVLRTPVGVPFVWED